MCPSVDNHVRPVGFRWAKTDADWPFHLDRLARGARISSLSSLHHHSGFAHACTAVEDSSCPWISSYRRKLLPTVPGYSRVVVVGHSLGSVLAYDTLNALINEDQVCAKQRGVVSKTRALITFGSPLDKTAFMFRLDAKGEEQW